MNVQCLQCGNDIVERRMSKGPDTQFPGGTERSYSCYSCSFRWRTLEYGERMEYAYRNILFVDNNAVPVGCLAVFSWRPV